MISAYILMFIIRRIKKREQKLYFVHIRVYYTHYYLYNYHNFFYDILDTRRTGVAARIHIYSGVG